ncbi:MAG: adenylyltransferase/cytidyltransferase family protein [Ardenticatenales bacterium]|nr:adenylyltransferase/cytidyltransferase family protein [Ardenticatenales bacterium]
MRKAGLILAEPESIQAARARIREKGARLAFTNGVFDLLHVGHLRYLQAAAALADVLWVGLNSDESVRHLKGEQRPLVPWAERAELLAALQPVEAVLFFNEWTADDIIRLVQPDLYVKGGDYTVETLPEAPTAHSIGAEVKILPFVEGHATTQLIELILNRYSSHEQRPRR